MNINKITPRRRKGLIAAAEHDIQIRQDKLDAGNLPRLYANLLRSQIDNRRSIKEKLSGQ